MYLGASRKYWGREEQILPKAGFLGDTHVQHCLHTDDMGILSTSKKLDSNMRLLVTTVAVTSNKKAMYAFSFLKEKIIFV